jgi:hypothetical protein
MYLRLSNLTSKNQIVLRKNIKLFCVRKKTMLWGRDRLNEKISEAIKKTTPKAFQASLPNQKSKRDQRPPIR